MNEQVSILGAGESGTGAALLAKAKGFSVFVSDLGKIEEKYRLLLESNEISFEENKHSEDKILKSSLVIKSPGISDKAGIVVKILQNSIPVISEIEFASRYTNAKLIAITGSNGKTTTTLFTYHILKKLGLNVGLAGNVGESLAKQVIEDTKDFYVLELSSFQLDGMYEFHANIAILLNITPDHLDRYDYKFENYIKSKFRIIRNMTSADHFITFVDDDVIKNEIGEKVFEPFVLSVSLIDRVLNGAYLTQENIFVNINNTKSKFFSVPNDHIPLKGKHNYINAMCAILVATVLNFDESKIIPAMKDFKNAPHRMELIEEVNGVIFINDSKATNVDSLWYALDSMIRPVILIMGGQDKGNDYSKITSLIQEKVKAIVCLGKDNSKIINYYSHDIKIIDTHSITDAVRSSFGIAKEGDVILLSPACASFDLFKNYEERGEKFRTEVMKLVQEIGKYNL